MFEEFYKKHIVNAVVSGDLVMGLCPFHEDGKQSFSAYIDSGLWACFGSCNVKGRTPEEFIVRQRGVTLTEAAELLSAEVGVDRPSPKRGRGRPRKEETEPTEEKLVPMEDVEAKHKALLDNTQVLTAITDKRLWSLEVIKQFKVGWDAEDDRVWIPVFNRDGACVDVRRYDWAHKHPTKFLPYAKGYGRPRPWPGHPKPDEEILLVEGEPDCLLARTLGFNAYTSTGGAGTPLKLACKRVTVLYDADEAGRKGAEKMLSLLRRTCGECKDVPLPEWEGMPSNADFTDYVKMVGDIDRLKGIIESAWTDEEATAPRVNLSSAIQAHNYGRLLRVAAVASGKNLSPFQVPRKGVVVCPQGLVCCSRCGIEPSAGRHEFEVRRDSPKLIECADEPSARVRAILKEHLGIPKGCTVFELEVKEVQNIFDTRLTSLVDLDAGESDKAAYMAIQAWATENIDLNTPFILTSRAVPDPKTQASTLIITKVESDKTSIDDYNLDSEQVQELRIFQPIGAAHE